MPVKQYNYTVDKGTYILAIKLNKPAEITVGKLGRFNFPAGRYLYFGSAMNGLHARIARHLRSDKKLHWHIDYFLQRAKIVDIWYVKSEERLECELCREAMGFPDTSVPVKGFGSSDCKCESHLLYFK
ncbi:MAG: GIY-YIG nuclease family protein [Dehalococcoidia bacterium]|jgi:sugar fermentation stimulation protein A